MEGPKNEYVSHMVGIVPVQGGPKNDGYPWPHALTPLYKNYTALHRAVLECAIAGCSSIWVIAEKKHIPLLKAVVGVYVEDPILAQLPVEFKDNFKMKIPIWYTSVSARDIGRRNCYGWTILTGADVATRVATTLTKGATPEKFYVAFPQSVYSPWRLQKFRKKIKGTEANWYVTSENKTIKDGTELGFTFFSEDFKRFKKDFREKDQGSWQGPELGKLVRRPIEERNLGAKLGLDEVFQSATMGDAMLHECPKVYNISDWAGYVEYISSPHHYKMPKKIKYFRFNKMKNIETRHIECGVYDDDDLYSENGSSKV